MDLSRASDEGRNSKAREALIGGTVAYGRLIKNEAGDMLRWALIFLVVALIAAFLGFGGLAGAAIDIAKILFFVFLVLFLVSAVLHLVRGRAP